MLRVEQVLTLLHLESELLSVLLQSVHGLILADVLCKLIIGIAVGLLREVDGVLDDGHIVLVDKVLALRHLQNEVTGSQLVVLQLVHAKGVQGGQVSLRVGVHAGCILVHGTGEPLLLTLLAILLGNRVEGGTGLQGCHDAVGRLAGCINGSTTHLNHAELNRVGHLLLRHELHHIERIVVLGLEGLRRLSDGHRVDAGGNVRRQCIPGHGQTEIGNLRLSLTHNLGGACTALQLLRSILHGLHQLSTVCVRCYHLEVHVLDVARLGALLVLFLLLVVELLQFSVAHLNVLVVDSRVSDRGQLNVALRVLSGESSLGTDGVAQQAVRQQ